MFRGRRRYRLLVAAMLAGMMLAVAPGCHIFDVGHQPMVHNPFPQLSRVAVAPFFNQSDEPTVDGRKFALAYFAELQATPGFEIVPLGVVEEAILEHQVDLSHAGEARRLARILNVDAVVIGSITDYDPYYPPRCGMRVEWYAANPGFHEIPPGYGLPWGTPEEEFIPPPLVFEAEMAQAKAEFAAQTPQCELPSLEPPARAMPPSLMSAPMPLPAEPSQPNGEKELPPQQPQKKSNSDSDSVRSAFFEAELAEESLPPHPLGALEPLPALQPEPAAPAGTIGAIATDGGGCVPNHGPVMTHTRIYHGHDGDFTAALANYYYFRNDARFGGWQNYLQRSEDFIRFCCHMHISEMLSARGGADKTRVVWRRSDCR